MILPDIAKIEKPASLASVQFALRRFSLRCVQDLGERHRYSYFRMKEPHWRITEPHEYRYIRLEEPQRYGYLIVKKFDKDIQGRQGFEYWVIVAKFLEV